MRKKSDEKNPKSCILLKRPKIAFLGEKIFPIKKPPLYSPRSEYRGGFLNGEFFVVFFLVKESRRRRKKFQDLVSDLKENLLKIAFLMLKTPKIFACGADLPLLLEQICIISTCDIDVF